ncbi:C-type lectin domain family 17, member A-like [Sphaeramia orbicularis]|uniref:C-type lectin domain family 17, member A-like n=1 Tax=Sphaeramia orbicularis TaxID=375764 RepID=A0A672Y7F4_9TELE|nr:C-type lectin domain family 17, member A-like [Sphaeramia orbicularis]
MEMDDLYDAVEDKPAYSRPLAHETAPQVSNRGLRGAVVFLGLLCGFLAVGLIGVRVHYFLATRALAAELFFMKSNLHDCIQTGNDHISNLTEERDRLNASLVKATQELKKLGMVRTCPEGWKLFSSSCYFLSTVIESWETARDNCRNKSADLLIINTKEEQDFISGFNMGYWIGLSDHEQEGTWTWVDGSPVTLSFWYPGQPDNHYGEEHCGIMWYNGQWNDLNCKDGRRWICEK